MVKMKMLVGFLLSLLLLSLVAAESAPVIKVVSTESEPLAVETELKATADGVQEDCLYYFYGTNCDTCAESERFLQQLELRYPQLRVQRYEIYLNKENYDLLQNLFISYAVPDENQGIPTIFLPNTYFVGQASIKDLLEESIIENADTGCPALGKQETVIGVVGEKSSKEVLDTLTFSKLTRSSLAESYDIGPLSLLLILLTVLVSLRSPNDVLKKGLFFSGAALLGYVGYGLGWYSLVQSGSQVTFVLAKAIGVLAVLIGLLNVKGFFHAWKIWGVVLSEQWHQQWNKVWGWISSDASMLIMGFLGSLLLIPHFGPTFVAMRVLLQDSATAGVVWPLLFYYCFILMLHLPLIVSLVFFGKYRLQAFALKMGGLSDTQRIKWEKHVKKLFTFLVSVLMLVLGTIILFMN